MQEDKLSFFVFFFIFHSTQNTRTTYNCMQIPIKSLVCKKKISLTCIEFHDILTNETK